MSVSQIAHVIIAVVFLWVFVQILRERFDGKRLTCFLRGHRFAWNEEQEYNYDRQVYIVRKQLVCSRCGEKFGTVSAPMDAYQRWKHGVLDR